MWMISSGPTIRLATPFGDDILCCMAKRILGVFRQTDIAARYGGDEFVVFVPSVGREILETRLQQLCEAFQQPYRNGTLIYQISGSVGAALFPMTEKTTKRCLNMRTRRFMKRKTVEKAGICFMDSSRIRKRMASSKRREYAFFVVGNSGVCVVPLI